MLFILLAVAIVGTLAEIPVTLTEDEITNFYNTELAKISTAGYIKFLSGRGLGVVSTRNLIRGDRIMAIDPQDTINEFSDYPFKKHIEDQGDDIVLIGRILWEKFMKKRPDTSISYYVHSLPTEMHNEITWEQEDIELFEKYSLTKYKSSVANKNIKKHDDFVEALKNFPEINPRVLEWESWIWAVANYKARNHSFAKAEWRKMMNLKVSAMDFLENTHVLIPMFDILNHSPLPGAGRPIDLQRPVGMFQQHGKQPRLEIRVDREYGPNEEIFYEYDAHKSNLDLVLSYGFSLENNIDDRLNFIMPKAEICHGTWLDNNVCQYDLMSTGLNAKFFQYLREKQIGSLLPEIAASNLMEFYSYQPVGRETRSSFLLASYDYSKQVMNVLEQNEFGLRQTRRNKKDAIRYRAEMILQLGESIREIIYRHAAFGQRLSMKIQLFDLGLI